jgi:hypothetical protein
MKEFYDQFPLNVNNKPHTSIQEPNLVGNKPKHMKEKTINNKKDKYEDIKKEFVKMLNKDTKKNPSQIKKQINVKNNSLTNKSGYSILNSQLEKNKNLSSTNCNYRTLTDKLLNKSLFNNESVKDQLKSFKTKFETEDFSDKTKRNQSTLLKNYNTGNYNYSNKQKNKNLIKNTIKSSKALFDESFLSSENTIQKSSYLQTETKEITLYQESTFIDQVNSLTAKIKNFTEREVKILPER